MCPPKVQFSATAYSISRQSPLEGPHRQTVLELTRYLRIAPVHTYQSIFTYLLTYLLTIVALLIAQLLVRPRVDDPRC